MIKLFYWPTPNGHKITMLLEAAGLEYDIVPINISRGEQFEESFLKIAPNNRMPAIVDEEPTGGGNPLLFLSLELFCSIWRKRLVNLSRMICVRKSK